LLIDGRSNGNMHPFIEVKQGSTNVNNSATSEM